MSPVKFLDLLGTYDIALLNLNAIAAHASAHDEAREDYGHSQWLK